MKANTSTFSKPKGTATTILFWRRTEILWSPFVFMACFGLMGWGCKKDSPEIPTNNSGTLGGVPSPLKNPAGFCFKSCQRKVTCKLGEPEGTEQKTIFETSVERCGHNCVEWIKSRPYEAAAQHTCYSKPRCSALLACLSETKRLMRYSSKPEKKRDCFKLCVDYGGCGGNEQTCLKLCNEGDLRIYRALEGCENRGCPQIKECVEKELKKGRI